MTMYTDASTTIEISYDAEGKITGYSVNGTEGTVSDGKITITIGDKTYTYILNEAGTDFGYKDADGNAQAYSIYDSTARTMTMYTDASTTIEIS